ncbi:hypothetical protein ACF3NG_08235 [Aerococcaceae bacterium WGS1372]
MLFPINFAYASSFESLDVEDEETVNTLMNDLELLTNQLNRLEKYSISFRFLNTYEGQLLVDGEIIGDAKTGDSKWLFDIYEYKQDDEVTKHTYDLVAYREFGLVYIKTIQLLEDSDFFNQLYFNEAIQNQFVAYSDYYFPISGTELEDITLNNSLLDNLLYLPNSDLMKQVDPENIYQLNNSTIVDVERLEIPRGLFQNSGSIALDYYFNIDISETNQRFMDYDVVARQRFNVSENAKGVSFKTKLESKITDSLIDQAPPAEVVPTDYEWDSNISTTHVTDKLTKATLMINPEMTTFSATLTGLYEQFLLNIFSNQTADIQSFNYRLELTISPTQKEIPTLAEIQTMTLTEFSYLLESSLTKKDQTEILDIQKLY